MVERSPVEGEGRNVLDLVRSADELDRRRGIVRLAREPTPEHLRLLRQLEASDPSPDLRFFARRALHLVTEKLAPGALTPCSTSEAGPDLSAFGLSDTRQKVALLRRLTSEQAKDLVPELLRLLAVEIDPVVLAALLLALGPLGGKTVVDELVPFLDHADARVRASAVTALEQTGTRRAYEHLLERVNDSDNRVRGNVALALRKLEGVDIRKLLVGMLKTQRPAMQASAAYVLRFFPSEANATLLAPLLEHIDGSVRSRARAALEHYQTKGVRRAAELLEKLGPAAGSAAETIEAMDAEVAAYGRNVDELTTALRAAESETRVAAIVRAVDRGGVGLGQVLLQHATGEQDARVLATLVINLGRLRYRPALGTLRRLLEHPDDRCRANAVEAIGLLELPRIERILAPALNDPNNRVRANAIVALRNCPTDAISNALERMVESDDERMQLSAIYALNELASEALVPLLQRLQKSLCHNVAERATAVLQRVRAEGLAEHRKVRVFVSSTFKDMHAERDHLVTVVYPELRERLERLGLEFFDVDLRWGVPQKDENQERANSWAYCKKWILRSHPFFICMLGER